MSLTIRKGTGMVAIMNNVLFIIMIIVLFKVVVWGAMCRMQTSMQ